MLRSARAQPSYIARSAAGRFTRVDAGTLRYEYTVDDPETFTRPFSAAIPDAAVRPADPRVRPEYARHEGNRGLLAILAGARVAERRAQP